MNSSASRVVRLLSGFAIAFTLSAIGFAQAQAERAHAVFADGQAQVVPAFQDQSQWIRERLWVETEFDSDKDGKKDRVFTDVTRPKQTDSEGLKVPVIYQASPYFAG